MSTNTITFDWRDRGRGVVSTFVHTAAGKLVCALRICREGEVYRLDYTPRAAGTWWPWEAFGDQVYDSFEAAREHGESLLCATCGVWLDEYESGECAECAATPVHNIYGWSVADDAGGRWWPDESAEAEIEAADDPGEAVLRICRESPTRGTWHS